LLSYCVSLKLKRTAEHVHEEANCVLDGAVDDREEDKTNDRGLAVKETKALVQSSVVEELPKDEKQNEKMHLAENKNVFVSNETRTVLSSYITTSFFIVWFRLQWPSS